MDRRKPTGKNVNKKITNIQTERKKRERSQYEQYNRPYKRKTGVNAPRNSDRQTARAGQNIDKRQTNITKMPKKTTQTKNRTKNMYTKRKKPRVSSAKRQNFKIMSSMFTGMLIIFMIAYFGISMIKGTSKKPIEYSEINYGMVDNHTKVDGVIIRDEVVYNATKTGVIEYDVAENEKVRKNEYIAKIKDQENVKMAEEDLKRINEQILDLQEKRKDLSLFSEDIKKVDTQIQTMLEHSIGDFLAYDMKKIYETKDYVEKNINIKNQMLLSESTGALEGLAEKKVSKEKELNKNISNIFTNDAGIISYYTDGLEDTFTMQNKNKITKEQTKMKETPKGEFKMSVAEGEPVFKIVRDNTFYIASYIKTKKIDDWEKGQEKTIYINDNGTLSPLLVLIEEIDIQEGESFVLLSCNRNMIDYVEKRNITFDINVPKKGYKVEKRAISKEKLLKIPKNYIDNSTVTKKTTEGEILIDIEQYIKEEDEQYIYISMKKDVIDIGDTILDKDKKELKLNAVLEMDGIYIVNSGIYTFTKIDTNGSTEDDQFIIIDPNKNKSIRLYDRYAPNVDDIIKKEKETVK